MRRGRIFLALLAVLVVLPIAGASSAKDSFHRVTLGNGLTVILEENPTAPVVALQIWLKVGSADERDEEAGMCHFIEHMIFKGSEKKNVREMAREIESLGGSINAYTSYDQTVYHVTIASRYAAVGLNLLADALRNPLFERSELEREREVILEEIRMGQDDPSRRIFKETMSGLFKKHPYRRPIIGYTETVKAITQDQMIRFFKRWYTPNRIVFLAVGDFDASEMERRIREVFEDFKPGTESPPARLEEPESEEVRSTVSYGNFKETYLQMAVPITSMTDEETPALDALSLILGGGETSRLVRKVKLEKGLVHSISASSFTPRDPGAFFIRATLPPQNLERAIEEILGEVSRLGNEGVTAEELYRVKVNVESDLVYDRQTVQGQARKMGYYQTITGDVGFEKEYMKRVALLQSEDLQSVVRKYFKATRWVISVLAHEDKRDVVNEGSLKTVVERGGRHAPGAGRQEASPFSRTVLENGIRLIVKEDRSNPIVFIQASFLGGVRFEPEAENGINHFIAVMLTKGTQNQDSLQIAKKMERMAGSVDGFSGYNSFGLTATVLSHHFEEAFALFAEVIKKPSFDPQEMEKRRASILAVLRQQEDELDRAVFKLFRETLFEKHPYRLDPLGNAETIQRLSQEDLKAYYRKMAVPENMVLTVVGDVSKDRVVLAARHEFGDLKGGKFYRPAVPQEETLRKAKRVEVYRQKEQAHFVLGFPGPTLYHEDRYALEVLDAALSGQGGRLFVELRDRESLAYALTFIAQPNLDPGYLGVYMGTHPDKVEKAIEGVLRILKQVREEGLTDDEVARAKRYLIGNFEIGLQTFGAQGTHMSLDELYGLGYDHYQRYPREVEKVTRQDIQRVCRTYLDLEAYALAIIRPPVEKRP